MNSPRHQAWTLGAGDAESVLAEARKALFVMVGFLAVLWIVQLVNVADHYQLTYNYGIRPRAAGRLAARNASAVRSANSSTRTLGMAAILAACSSAADGTIATTTNS